MEAEGRVVVKGGVSRYRLGTRLTDGQYLSFDLHVHPDFSDDRFVYLQNSTQGALNEIEIPEPLKGLAGRVDGIVSVMQDKFKPAEDKDIATAIAMVLVHISRKHRTFDC